jgi:hypothetical protein
MAWLIEHLFPALWAGWTPTSSPYLARGCAPSFGWVFFDRFSPRANIMYCSCAQRPPVDSQSEPQFMSNWYSVLPTSCSCLFLRLLAGIESRVQVDLATSTVNNRLELVQRLLRRHDLSFVVGSWESPPPPIEIIHLTERSGTPALSLGREGLNRNWIELYLFD